jgi:Ankyrin repeats (3 copies)
MSEDAIFHDALTDLEHGGFSRLEPLFVEDKNQKAPVVQWCEAGRFDDHPEVLAEALTCACFLGRIGVAEYLLRRGVNPAGGIGTGLNALHWAANRGQLEAVRLLLRWKAPLETRSMYDGTALGTAVWAVVHEPRGAQLQIIQELIGAGARVEEAEYPSGNEQVDQLLRQAGLG